jgi:hypothetical protein
VTPRWNMRWMAWTRKTTCLGVKLRPYT